MADNEILSQEEIDALLLESGLNHAIEFSGDENPLEIELKSDQSDRLKIIRDGRVVAEGCLFLDKNNQLRFERT